MFDKYPNQSDIHLIRRWGDEQGGQALQKYLWSLIEAGTQSFLRSRASDVESIAKSQGAIHFARQVLDLLTGDPKELVEQYAMPEEHNTEETQ